MLRWFAEGSAADADRWLLAEIRDRLPAGPGKYGVSMHDAERFKLLYGPYRMPRCRVGRRLLCQVRGTVVVAGISDAPIPWPVGQRGRDLALVSLVDVQGARRLVRGGRALLRLLLDVQEQPDQPADDRQHGDGEERHRPADLLRLHVQ